MRLLGVSIGFVRSFLSFVPIHVALGEEPRHIVPVGIRAQGLNLLVVCCNLVCEAIVRDGAIGVSFEVFDGEGIPYVSFRSCSTSYLRPASFSMIFLPSAMASGSVALVTAR
jgi:hypothetical protein